MSETLTLTDAETPAPTTEEAAARLRQLVVAGGNPYVLIVMEEEGANIQYQGFEGMTPELLAEGLREIADGLVTA
jgi:hypothetical protein